MSNQKLKTENYQNFGGINQKISEYLTSPLEFLDIKNFDFQFPGQLTQRWGSTQYVTQTFGSPISALYEFTRLNGASYVVVGHTGGIWSGATTGNSQGLSFAIAGVTTSYFFAFGQIFYGSPSGSEIAELEFQYRYQDVGPLLNGNGLSGIVGNSSGFGINIPQLQSDNTLSFVTFNNYVFAADGNKFFKSDGVTTSFVGLPAPLHYPGDPWGTPGGGHSFYFGTQAVSDVGFGMTGYYAIYASYVNRRGFESTIWPVLIVPTINAATFQASYGLTTGASFLGINLSVFTPLAYDIASINLYSYWQSATMTFNGSTNIWSLGTKSVFMGNTPTSGSTITYVPVGSTVGGQSALVNNIGVLAPNKGYAPLGMTFLSQISGNKNYVDAIVFDAFIPRYLEVYQNRLFCAGFSSALSTVHFSDLGEPEGFLPGNNFEVRTNDGDYIVGMVSYATRLYIFKRSSIHVLYGDNPQNFFLQEASTIYGCLNNRCRVKIEDLLIFLDQKGVMTFNGSSVECLSDKIQPIINRINYNVALSTACMVHDKIRNQVLIGVPLDSATSNNITLVYDYQTKSWTSYDGFVPTVFSTIQGRNNNKNAFYGSFSGVVNWFGPSFLSENGAGFTTYFKTRFLHEMGESVEEQWRRLYVNAYPGTTFVAPVKFYQDYGTSVVYSETLVMNSYQTRIDFGIQATALAFEFFCNQTAAVLKIPGFTVESRLQRRVSVNN